MSSSLLPHPLAVLATTPPPGGELSPVEGLILLAVFAAMVGFGALVLRKVWSRRGGDDAEGDARPTPAPAPAKARPKTAPAPPVADDLPTTDAAPETEPDPEPAPAAEAAASFRDGLVRTRKEGFMARLRRTLKREIAPDVVDEMEEILLTADIGVKTATRLLDHVRGRVSRKELGDGEMVLAALREESARILGGATAAADLITAPASDGPRLVMVVGVNGTGKTTTLGKLAHLAGSHGRRVMLVAGDTFRAAAVDQLRVWAERTGAAFHEGKAEADPASVVFDGVKAAAEQGIDLVLCDTAGRLHTNANLVEELKKVGRVAAKALGREPDATWLVLDATIGQNAVMQARSFTDALGVTGIVLTKLDGTARGGVVLGIVDQLSLPIAYVGVGERAVDLRPFDADEFLEGLYARD